MQQQPSIDPSIDLAYVTGLDRLPEVGPRACQVGGESEVRRIIHTYIRQ